MSYLNHPRLTFSGQFQADVSTVNNDPRHFDNETFESRFQEFQTSTTQNGWWNPIGTGVFRFSDCRIHGAIGRDGRADIDPAIGFAVGNSPDRPSGKIVDIDPDWQLASQLYGLSVSIVDPSSGKLALLADFLPAPFRDLWFSRGGGNGDSGASALWQSQLTHLRWDLDGIASPVLHALREVAGARGRLSIRIATFAYQTTASAPNFTYGRIAGVIGPVEAGEPKTFVAGRRFMPTGASPPPGPPASCVSANGMTCFSAKVVGPTLVADLSNALPLDSKGKLAPLGDLHFALLSRPDIQESNVIAADEYDSIGLVEVSEGLLIDAAGIQTLAIPAALMAHIHERPLALVQLGSEGVLGQALVMMREVPHGRDVGADVFSFRLDPNEPRKNHRDVPLYATRYGLPLANAAITFQPGPPAPDLGDAPTDSTPGTTPTAAIPFTNSPIGILDIQPPVVTTDEAGRAKVRFQGPATMASPRNYIDGQLYSIPFNFAEGPPTILQTFDQISVLVFSSFHASAQPTWAEVQPILQQYANLYPIMSKGLFDFSIQAVADANAHLLHFVLSRPFDDPDHMPVTRDLSAGKRGALLKYFEHVMCRSAIHAADTLARYTGRCPFSGVTPSERPEDVAHKIVFNQLRSR